MYYAQKLMFMFFHNLHVVILFLFLSGCIGGFILLRPTARRKELTIELTQLSNIWTRYNEGFEPVKYVSESNVVDNLVNNSFPEKKSKKSTSKKKTDTDTPKDSVAEDDQKGKQTEVSPEQAQDNTDSTVPVEVIEEDIEDVSEGVVEDTSESPSADGEKRPLKIEDLEHGGMPALPIKEFWDYCVEPYKKEFEQQGVIDVLQELLDILETNDCPSVVVDKNDIETTDIYSVKDNLAQVSLKVHSYNVAIMIVNLLKERFKDYAHHIPKSVLAALAHDIGKIGKFRQSKIYNTSEHQIVSAHKFNELMSGKDIFWTKSVYIAIESHHYSGATDEYSALLRQADRSARQQELIQFTKGFVHKPFEQWFSIDEFYKKIDLVLNYDHRYSNKWPAMTYRDIIYCRADFLHETIRTMAREAQVLDLTFILESERETAIRTVINALRSANLIPDELGSNFYTRRYEISTVKSRQKHMLTPLKPISWLDMRAVEARKQGYLTAITKMRGI